MKYYVIVYLYADGRKLIKGVVEHEEIANHFVEKINQTLPNKYAVETWDTKEKLL